MADDRRDGSPLEGEARKRGTWRGGGTHLSEKDAGGHTLPASEDLDEAVDGEAADRPRTIAPPD